MTKIPDIFPFLPPILLGFFIVRNVLTGAGGKIYSIAVFGGIGLGLGIHSLLFFLTYISQTPFYYVIVLEITLIILLGWKWLLKWKGKEIIQPQQLPPGVSLWLAHTLTAVFIFSCINTGANYFQRAWQMPHGDGDAYMCWNLKARYMFAAGESNWQGVFTKNFTHPDYPLLVPGAIAASWKQAESESLTVPIMVHFFFAFAVAGLLYSSVRLLRSRMMAQVAGLFILCTPFFIFSATDQFADLPLSFFYLLSFVMLTFAFSDVNRSSRRPLFLLLGLCAALTAWTKNEGILFFVVLAFCIAAVFFFHKESRSDWWSLLFYFLGALLTWAIILYFKIVITPTNDLVVVEKGTTLSHFTDLSRYWTVAKAYLFTGATFGQWLFTPLPAVLLYVILSGLKRNPFAKCSLIIASTIVLILGGYFFMYTGFYFEHIGSSLDRLMLQVLPSGVFLFCLMVKTPEEMLGQFGN